MRGLYRSHPLSMSNSRRKTGATSDGQGTGSAQEVDVFAESAPKVLRRLVLLGVIAPLIQLAYNAWIGQALLLLKLQIVAIVVMALCYWELRAGRVARGLRLFSWAMWFFAYYAAFTVAGMHTPALILIPCMTMIVAWSQGRRAAYTMMFASVGALILLVLAGRNDWLPPPTLRTPEQTLITYVATIIIVGVVAIVIADNVRSLIAKARSASAQLRSMLDSATEVAIISMDLSGHVTMFNPGAQQMLGYDEQEMLGQLVGKYVPSYGMKARANDLSKALGAHKVGERPEDIVAATIELGGIACNSTYTHKDGHDLHVSVVTSVVKDDEGQPVALLSIARDVTAQIAAEASVLKLNLNLETKVRERTAEVEDALARVRERTEELQRTYDDLHATKDKLVQAEKLASLGSLVAAVAHELNTPIGTCVSVSSTLGNRVTSLKTEVASGAVRKSALEAFFADAENATSLLNRNLERSARLISTFRQVAADARSLNRKVVSLSTLMKELNTGLALQLRGSPIELKCQVIHDGEIDSYPEAITNVIDQLIDNALKHGFEGRTNGTITLSAQANDVSVTFSVVDDGVGMDEATCRRAFDPFFTTRLGKGTSGLGLYICYNLVTGPLGGTIGVTSTQGDGSCFTLTLPCVAPNLSVA